MVTRNNFQMGSGETYTGDTFINPYTLAAGSNNTFIDCIFDQQNESYNWSCFVLTAKNNVSSVGNKFINCTFKGGLEEQGGADNHRACALWSVSSINGSDISLTLVRDPYNKRNTYGVGAHLASVSGDSIGNYYLVTARSGDTFTISSDKFAVDELSVGDEVVVVMAVVDCEWTNCTAITTKTRIVRSVHWKNLDWVMGFSNKTTIVTGFSNYGFVFGSIYDGCEVIGDGLSEVGGSTGYGVEVVQTGFWTRGVIQNNTSDAITLPQTDPIPTGIPHHTTFKDCKTSGVDQAFNGGVFQLGLYRGDYVFPPEYIEDVLGTHQVAWYPSSYLTVTDCDFTGGQFPNLLINVAKTSWSNTLSEPSSLFDVSLQRFGTLWKSEFPFSDPDNATAHDPFPTRSVDVGEQSYADYTIDGVQYVPYIPEPEPQQPFFAGDQAVTKLYIGTQEVNLKAGE